MKKIAYIISQLDRAGTELEVLSITKRTDRSLYNPMVISFERGGEIESEFMQLGIDLVELEKKGTLDAGFLARLVRLLRRKKVRIVHSFLISANFWGVLAARLARVPVIVSSVMTVYSWAGKAVHTAARVGALLSHAVTVNTELGRKYLIENAGIPPHKLHRVYSAVDTDRFRAGRIVPEEKRSQLGIPPGARVVGMAAVFYFAKDYATLSRAARIVVNQIPDCVFLFVGGCREPEERKRIEDLVTELDLTKNVIFTGSLDCMEEVLSLFDVAVLSTHVEGCSVYILEAMASGKPVVATDVGGNRELVRHGVTGFLTPHEDPEDLAARILDLLENPAVRTKMGRAGRERAVEKFSLTCQIEAFQRIYRDIERSKTR
jgi:glycosyltransferase involved in cell wall biosynthesis